MIRFTFSAALAASLLAACGGSSPKVTPDAATPAAQIITITATHDSTRFVTREHMLAAGEMQISGEPFAEAMDRDLANYSRDHLPTDIYFDTSPTSAGPWIDLPGFSTGVESYEYSKQPMNNLEFESGAGTSLLFGPLVNPGAATGSDATALMAAAIQHYATGAHTTGRFVFPAGTFPTNNASGTINPTGAGSAAENPLGWPGIWPTNHVFRSFDPAIAPTSAIALALRDHVGRRPRRERRARLRRLRVRRDDAASAVALDADRADHHARRRRLLRVEVRRCG